MVEEIKWQIKKIRKRKKKKKRSYFLPVGWWYEWGDWLNWLIELIDWADWLLDWLRWLIYWLIELFDWTPMGMYLTISLVGVGIGDTVWSMHLQTRTASMARWPNVLLMLDHRLRRWSNIRTTLIWCLGINLDIIYRRCQLPWRVWCPVMFFHLMPGQRLRQWVHVRLALSVADMANIPASLTVTCWASSSIKLSATGRLLDISHKC